MRYSSLEITEKEYLIKLSKDDFELPFINQLLKRIQAEQLFFSKTTEDAEEDIISRISNSQSASRFDNLRDK
ncbi:hypothetical protein [Daejeonella oryzae]|uniref:hypothetical protein n=1 Tax=Daejeonella oryzae TaxID=1122943 RepID=UPI00047C59D5|nr:hypothetical protein [Daejeonella oryzae]